jgi:TonB family protein
MWVLGVVLAATSAAAPGARADAQQTDAPIRVGGNVRAPGKIKDVVPVYPDEARAAGVQGVVVVEITVDATGRVSDARVLRSMPMLDRAALDAVKQWEFRPTVLEGSPVAVKMTVPVVVAPEGAARRASEAPLVRGGGFGGAGRGWVGTGTGSMTTFNNGAAERYEFGGERFAKLPAWDPVRVPEPPVSVGTAVITAQAWMQQRHPEHYQFEVMSIVLRPMGPTWMYHVGIVPRQQERPVPQQAGTVIVLMDGTVLEPQRAETR